MMSQDGWQARFLDADALSDVDAKVMDALLVPRLPRFMVVDYADTRREVVEALLRRALDKKSGQPVRLVLLARGASDWWRQLLARRYEYQELPGAAGDSYPVLPLAVDEEARKRVFDAAVEAFARTLEGEPPTQRPPDLSGKHFQRVLFLHMSALALGSVCKVMRDGYTSSHETK
jgi:hypothetical protein